MSFDLSDSRPKTLMMAVRRFNRLAMPKTGVFSSLDIKPSEIFLMVHLKKVNEGEGLKPSDLAERLGVSPGNVTQLITSLEARGLVMRSHDADDRRVIRIRLTSEGEKAINEAHQAMAESFAGLIEHMGSEECDQLIVLLDKASEYFSARFGIDATCCQKSADCSHDSREGTTLC